jgi:serine phosphatase RsbU (regulator of sigma subunit)
MSLTRSAPGRLTTAAFVVIGLGVALWLWRAVPQRDAALHDPRLTRSGVVGRARELAREFGLDSAGWRATAKLDWEPRGEQRLFKEAAHRSTLARPGRFAEVLLIDPQGARGGRRRARLRLGEDGRLLSWELLGENAPDSASLDSTAEDAEENSEPDAEKRAPDQGPPAQQPAAAPGGPALAAQVSVAVQRLAGAEAPRFRPISSRPPQPDDSYELEAQDPSSSRLVWQIRLAFKNGRLVKAALEPDVEESSYFKTFGWHLSTFDLWLLGEAMVWIAGIGATLAGFQALRRHRFKWRWYAITCGALALLSAWSWWCGARSDVIAAEFAQGREDGVTAALQPLQTILWCAWVLMAAEAGSQRFGGTEAWAQFRMALAGRCSEPGVARAVSTGIGAGGVLALCSIAPEMLATPEPLWRVLGLGGLSPSPLSDALASCTEAAVLPVPLFALAWAARFRRPWLRALMMLTLAWFIALLQVRSELSVQLLAWTALASAAATVLTYWLAGALAVAVALPAAALWLAGAGTVNGVAMAVLAALGLLGLVFGMRPEQPVDAVWMPLDEADLPSTRREKLKAEFTDAREAQQRLLPATAPALAGYEVAACCVPAADVGGDLYDFHTLPDGRTLFSVADVSGKGMPAALYMTLCKGVLAAVCEQTAELERIAALLNRHLYAAGGRGRGQRKVFVTAALAALRPESGAVEIARAGHNPPLLVRADGQTAFLKPSGLAFGMVPPAVFDPRLNLQTVTLERGDALVLYSDGISEGMDREQEQFGEERLIETLREPGSAQALCGGIIEAVRDFAAGAAQHDDMTLVVIKRET